MCYSSIEQKGIIIWHKERHMRLITPDGRLQRFHIRAGNIGRIGYDQVKFT